MGTVRKVRLGSVGVVNALADILGNIVKRRTTFCELCISLAGSRDNQAALPRRVYNRNSHLLLLEYSQTILLIFTPLLILVVVLMSVGLLSSVGGEKLPSTLNVSVGVPSKRD